MIQELLDGGDEQLIAEQIGLEVGDEIVSVAGSAVTSNTLGGALKEQIDTTFVLVTDRNGEQQEYKVTCEDMCLLGVVIQ